MASRLAGFCPLPPFLLLNQSCLTSGSCDFCKVYCFSFGFYVQDHLENISPVAYVDLVEGATEGFVRFQSPAGPEAVLQELRQAELEQLQLSLSSITGR